MNGILEQEEIRRERGPDRVSPNFLPNVLVDSASGQLAISLGIKGPNYAVVSACATGSHAIGEAAELIKRGDADAMLAGGGEACMHPLILAGFTAMRGLAVEDEDPPRASRPFDATRAGFVMGEGACVFVLEDLEAAQARGARVYAEVLGYGASNDAHHMAQPEPEATGVADMMRAALRRAGVEPERVGYINAHGTSTPLGDLAETKAIKDVFGDHAYKLAVSSTKSMMGHTFGAAGAIEAMMCVLALHEGVIPPTINYRHPDPDCDLDYVPNEAREVQVDVALSNAMGLGGHNGCVLLGRVEVSFIVDPRVEEYAEAHTSPDGELFERLAAETREKTTAPQMMVGDLEGRFLGALVRSTARAARARARHVHRLLVDLDGARAADRRPRDHLRRQRGDDRDRAPLRRGGRRRRPDRLPARPGLETIAQLDGPFDLVFIDADKPNYVQLLRGDAAAARRGRADRRRTTRSGRAASSTTTDDENTTQAIQRFQRPRVRTILASRTCCSPSVTG